MSSKALTLVVKPRGKPIKRLPADATVSTTDSAEELYKKIAGAAQFSIHRLRITKGSDGAVVPNSTEVNVWDLGLRGGSVVVVKDLGPQIGWRTCYLIEYLGALLIHPLIYLARPYIYPTPSLSPSTLPPPSPQQTLFCALVTLHFAKRELETLFVHRFSAATMPFRNIFKNSAHYWLLAGANIAYWTYAPSSYAASPSLSPLVMYVGLALFGVGEVLNLLTHLVLRDLRRPGSRERGIPQGYGFGVVTCPNYMWEIVAWVGMAVVGVSGSTLLFLVVGAAQMGIWAKGKERRYRKDFGERYVRKRYVLVPGVW